MSATRTRSFSLTVGALLVALGASGCRSADLLRDRRTLVPRVGCDIEERFWFWTRDATADRRIALDLPPALRRVLARAHPELPESDAALILEPLAHAESLWFVVDRRASVGLVLRVREAEGDSKPIVELVVSQVTSLPLELEGYRIQGLSSDRLELSYELAIPVRASYEPGSTGEERGFRLANVLRVEVVAPLDDDLSDVGKALALPFVFVCDVVLSPFELHARHHMLKQWRASAGHEANE